MECTEDADTPAVTEIGTVLTRNPPSRKPCNRQEPADPAGEPGGPATAPRNLDIG